jgi:hypothetical protein
VLGAGVHQRMASSVCDFFSHFTLFDPLIQSTLKVVIGTNLA